MNGSSARRVTRGFGTWNDGTQLSRPQGLACIGRHIYIADSENHVIRRINCGLLENLEIVAGMGRSVWGKFDGEALGTSLTAPCAIFPGADGEIYITSSWDSMLWQLEGGKLHAKIGMNGSGFKDGPVANARLDSPTGGCYYAEEDLIFLVDSEENRIRTISRRDGVVKSIGDGASVSADAHFKDCSFMFPYSICRLPNTAEPIFLVTEFSCIRSIRYARSLVDTYAGTPKPGFADGPRKDAQFRELKEIVATKNKTIFVADYGNGRIRMISPTGVVSTLVRLFSPPAGLVGPMSETPKTSPVGLCLTPHGDLVFSQPKLNIIQVVHDVIDPVHVVTYTSNYHTPIFPSMSLDDLIVLGNNSGASQPSVALPLPYSFLSIVHPNIITRFDKFRELVSAANLSIDDVAFVLASELFPTSWSPTEYINMFHILKQSRVASQFRNSLLIELENRLSTVPLIELVQLMTHVELHCNRNKRLGSIIANAMLIQMSSEGMVELPTSLSVFGAGRFESDLLAHRSQGTIFVPKNVKAADTHIRSCMERLYNATVSSQRLSADKSTAQQNELIASLAPCNFHIISPDGYAIPVHDWLLYARWPFFRHIVDSGAEEWVQSKKIQIPTDTFSRHTLRAFIKFIYTNRVDAATNNDAIALEVLLHAQRYNLADMNSPPIPHPTFVPLLSACEIVFDQVTTLENCADKYVMAKDYGREAHHHRIAVFIAEHFKELMAEPKTRDQILALGPHALASI